MRSAVPCSLRFLAICACFVSSAGHAQDDPRLINITTLEQLYAVRYDLDGDGVADDILDTAKYTLAFGSAASGCPGVCLGYELMADLDFSGTKWEHPDGGTYTGTREVGGWLPIGDFHTFGALRGSFSGIFEGNGHTISNLYIKRSNPYYVGLFASLHGTIFALRLEQAHLTNTYRHANAFVGGIAAFNSGTIVRSAASGVFFGGPGHRSAAGGLVGYNAGSIAGCYATGVVNAEGTGDTTSVGGLVGHNLKKIAASYATAAVNGDTRGQATRAGGLVGWNDRSGSLTATYATGAVSGANYTGALAGRNDGEILGSYATGTVEGTERHQLYLGGLVGLNRSNIASSYYDNAKSFLPTAIGENSETATVSDVCGRTTEQLQHPTGYTDTIYARWNVDVDGTLDRGVDDAGRFGDLAPDDPWDFGTADEYPLLKVDFNGDRQATAAEFGPQRHTGQIYFYASEEDRTANIPIKIYTARPSALGTLAAHQVLVDVYVGCVGVASAQAVEFLMVDGLDAEHPSTNTDFAVVQPPTGHQHWALHVGARPVDISAPLALFVLARQRDDGNDTTTELKSWITVSISPDYDSDGDGLVEIHTLAQLDAMRYDLNGDGIADRAVGDAILGSAFGGPSCVGACTGYELMADLDFVGTKWEDPVGGTYTGIREDGGWLPIGWGSWGGFCSTL